MTPWLPIDTDRLLLRELRPDDEAGLHAYESDPEVVRFDDWGPNTAAETSAILKTVLEEQLQWPRDAVTAGIELRSADALIGTIHITMRDKKNLTADLGYTLNRQFWHRGYASEAARAFLTASFASLELHRICATCDTRNSASYRVMEKLGMRREGLFRRDIWQRGEWRDSYLYAILAEELSPRGWPVT